MQQFGVTGHTLGSPIIAGKSGGGQENAFRQGVLAGIMADELGRIRKRRNCTGMRRKRRLDPEKQGFSRVFERVFQKGNLSEVAHVELRRSGNRVEDVASGWQRAGWAAVEFWLD
jgi:hypothetical protein